MNENRVRQEAAALADKLLSLPAEGFTPAEFRALHDHLDLIAYHATDVTVWRASEPDTAAVPCAHEGCTASTVINWAKPLAAPLYLCVAHAPKIAEGASPPAGVPPSREAAAKAAHDGAWKWYHYAKSFETPQPVNDATEPAPA